MNVFRSDILDKQVKKSSNREDIIERLNFIIKKLFNCKTEDDIYKINEGAKKYAGKNYKVYGIDLGKGHSMSAERLIVSFVRTSDERSEMFNRVIDDEEKKKELSILLHFYCKHDLQNKKADLINDAYIDRREYTKVEDEFTIEEQKMIEDGIQLKTKFQYQIFDEYTKPTVTVLTMDKYDKINPFITNPQPTILKGIAGSGKTEIIIKIIHDVTKMYSDKKILYITCSENLINTVLNKCKTFETKNVEFESLKSLIRMFNKEQELDEFENYQTFQRFINFYQNNSKNVDYVLKNNLIKFINNNSLYSIYSEIYGLLMGYMLDDWNRNDIEIIKYQDYEKITDKYRIINRDESNNVYKLALAYIDYLKKNSINSFNIECMKILQKDIVNKYDYVLVDEVQDLTECQIKMLFNLTKNQNNILLCGDIKQVINPTSFDFGRIKKLIMHISEKNIYDLRSNFRNSKSVTELINYINDIRNKKLPSYKEEDKQLEESKNTSPGNIYHYVGDVDELIDIFDEIDGAIIVDEEEYELLEKNNINTDNVYTVWECKGMEFDNVCVLNILSNKREVFDMIWNNDNIKDRSLHYNFNLFYVAITRSKFNLILLEKEHLSMFDDILENIDIDEAIDVSDIDLTRDKTAMRYYEKGFENLTNDLYLKAKRQFERAIYGDKVDYVGIDKIEKMIDICDIYLNETKDSTLANIFEEKEFYDYAYKHYRALNNYSKMAIMKLMLDEEDEFERILKKYNLNIFDIYNNNEKYQNKIYEYMDFDNKIINLNEYNSNIKDLINKFNLSMKEIKILD